MIAMYMYLIRMFHIKCIHVHANRNAAPVMSFYPDKEFESLIPKF